VGLTGPRHGSKYLTAGSSGSSRLSERSQSWMDPQAWKGDLELRLVLVKEGRVMVEVELYQPQVDEGQFEKLAQL